MRAGWDAGAHLSMEEIPGETPTMNTKHQQTSNLRNSWVVGSGANKKASAMRDGARR